MGFRNLGIEGLGNDVVFWNVGFTFRNLGFTIWVSVM